jgi:hypothetical protein
MCAAQANDRAAGLSMHQAHHCHEYDACIAYVLEALFRVQQSDRVKGAM